MATRLRGLLPSQTSSYAGKAAAPVAVDVALSTQFTIKLPPDDRILSLAFDDRLIRIPPDRRKIDLS